MPKKVRIELDFDHGDEVYLVTEPEPVKRLVTGIRLMPQGLAMYTVSLGDLEPTEHYAFELSATKPVT